MKIDSLKLVCFSPTGTTKKIIQTIAQGINHNNVELIDITKANERKQSLYTSEKDLIVVGVPVYMGRVPALLSDYLHEIQANKTPAVCVVVYGNRMYGDALLELSDVLKKGGCLPIGGCAFIGEHSFSSSDLPIAINRPDENDIKQAELFGRRVKKKLMSILTIDSVPELQLPGNYPYGGVTELWSVDFIQTNDNCTKQGICAEVCPVGAIDTHDCKLIDLEKCISCCACIKACPEKVRTIKPGRVHDAAIRLNKLFDERKEPELFI